MVENDGMLVGMTLKPPLKMDGYRLLLSAGAVHMNKDNLVLHMAEYQTPILFWYQQKCVFTAEY